MSLIDFLVNVELDTPRPDYRALLITARNVTSPAADTPAAPSAFQPHVAAWRTAWQNAGLDPALFELGAQPSDAPWLPSATPSPAVSSCRSRRLPSMASRAQCASR